MKKTMVTLLTLSLAACGGGGGDDAPTTTGGNDQQPVAKMPIGLWQGSVTADNEAFDVVGMIAPSGEARFISSDGEQDRFTIVLDGSSYTADGVGYDIDGYFLGDVEITGTYTETEISGTAEVDSVEVSTFSLTLAEESAEGASLSTITGNYSDVNQSASIAIDADGVLSGSDTDGCVYTGNVTVPEASVNVYSLSINVSSCGEFGGDYTGLATYTQIFDDSNEKGFIFQVDNDNYLVTDVLFK